MGANWYPCPSHLCFLDGQEQTDVKIKEDKTIFCWQFTGSSEYRAHSTDNFLSNSYKDWWRHVQLRGVCLQTQIINLSWVQQLLWSTNDSAYVSTSDAINATRYNRIIVIWPKQNANSICKYKIPPRDFDHVTRSLALQALCAQFQESRIQVHHPTTANMAIKPSCHDKKAARDRNMQQLHWHYYSTLVNANRANAVMRALW